MSPAPHTDERNQIKPPSFVSNVIHNPRRLFLRRALFQIHLWSGIFLTIYVVIIAVTGSILVFEDEFTATTLPPMLSRYDPADVASIETVMRAFEAACPQCNATNLQTPSPAVPAYQIRAVNPGRRTLHLVADPVTAAIYLQPRTWIEWVRDLHVYLLLGEAHGEQINGVGAVILLILTITGIVLWWPGLRNWSRGLKLSFRHNWRRINYDAHSAIGFWTLFIVTWWAISGIYFSWYRQVVAAVNIISPIQGMNLPALPALGLSSDTRASLESILTAAQHASPQGHLFSLSDPSLNTCVVYVLMDLRAPGDFSHRDIVTVDTTNSRVLTVWHYGQNHTLGDWIIWSMHPLHFGTLWGLLFKILWFLVGLSLAILAITGLLMYWNRYLRRFFRPAVKAT
jgi:uncharacterized iron-regulated membrane protein